MVYPSGLTYPVDGICKINPPAILVLLSPGPEPGEPGPDPLHVLPHYKLVTCEGPYLHTVAHNPKSD